MTDYLMLTLYSPMAAMGDIAVGERRASSSVPSKSAILGLVAAALGIDRADTDKHVALEKCYGFGVLVNEPGRPLDDYHTIQTASQSEIRKWSKTAGHPPETRKQLLEAESLETILSTRGYRTDALYTATLWAKEPAPFTLEDIKSAILEPHYTLYFGRKACPFSLPLCPEIISDADTPGKAFRKYIESKNMREIYALINSEHHDGNLIWHADAEAIPEEDKLYTIQRRDRIVNRTIWQFLPREEAVAQLPKDE